MELELKSSEITGFFLVELMKYALCAVGGEEHIGWGSLSCRCREALACWLSARDERLASLDVAAANLCRSCGHKQGHLGWRTSKHVKNISEFELCMNGLALGHTGHVLVLLKG